MDKAATPPATQRKTSIQSHLKELSQKPGHESRLGVFTPLAGYPLLLLFALFLLPLYLYMCFFNRVYFWIRKQKPIARDRYLQYDRHQVAHLTVIDKVFCEYCEWANGSLHWTLKITNELEKRYCPIKNKPAPKTLEEKPWREGFLEHDHEAGQLDSYYKERYGEESKGR